MRYDQNNAYIYTSMVGDINSVPSRANPSFIDF